MKEVALVRSGFVVQPFRTLLFFFVHVLRVVERIVGRYNSPLNSTETLFRDKKYGNRDKKTKK